MAILRYARRIAIVICNLAIIVRTLHRSPAVESTLWDGGNVLSEIEAQEC